MGSLSIRPEAEIVRWHEEQTNVVTAVTPWIRSGKRSFHLGVPAKRGQGAFAGIAVDRHDWAFHFRNVT